MMYEIVLTDTIHSARRHNCFICTREQIFAQKNIYEKELKPIQKLFASYPLEVKLTILS